MKGTECRVSLNVNLSPVAISVNVYVLSEQPGACLHVSRRSSLAGWLKR